MFGPVCEVMTLCSDTVRKWPGLAWKLSVGGPSCWCFMSGRGTAWPSSECQAASLLTQYLAWKTPWAEEPGGLQSTGLQSVGHRKIEQKALSPTNQHIDPLLTSSLHVISLQYGEADEPALTLPLTKVHSFTLGFILCVVQFYEF